jgi:predicted HTH transcriptional regulator
MQVFTPHEVEHSTQITEIEIPKSENAGSNAIPEIEDILSFIKEEGNRTTQKDIRKKFPLSEAKISLMIAELEAKGKVEKIKKGRGNIIVIKS